MSTNAQKIWLVKFPTYQYEEDVKDLARRGNLKIIDSKYRTSINMDMVATDVPKITVKPKNAKSKKADT